MPQLSPELMSQFAQAIQRQQAQRTEEAAIATPSSETEAVESVEATQATPGPETDAEAAPEFLRADPSDTPDVVEKKKNLERGFHEARRKDTERVRALEEQMKELATKANAFDVLAEAEDPASVIKGLRGEKPAEAAPPLPFGSSFAIPQEAADAFDEGTIKGILALIQAGTSHSTNALLQQLAPYKALIESIGVEKYNGQWAELDKEFPGASAHKTDVEKFAREHQVPVRQALMALKGEELMTQKIKAGVQAKKRAELVNPASVATPGSVKPSSTQKYDKKALAQAIIRQSKELGLPSKFQH